MSRPKLMLLFVFSAILVMTIWIVAAVICYWSNRSEPAVSERVLPKNEWPGSLVELVGDADRRNIQITELEVYSGPHDDYYWKCGATSELLDLMIARWGLSAAKKNHRVVESVLHSMPLLLSSSAKNSDIDYYVSAEYLPGGEWKGHLYCVMNDKTQKKILIRYYYNF